MHRCFVNAADWGDTIRLSADESHHLTQVCRARCGDVVDVFDGQGQSAHARILEHDRATTRTTPRSPVVLQIDPATRHVQARGADLVLLQAVLKRARMDLLIEKATELGVTSVQPVLSAHVIGGAKRNDDRQQRWERIAIAAAKQCGSNWIPDIRPIEPLEDVLATPLAVDHLIIGSLHANARLLRDVIQAWQTPNRVAILIGPEGDLTAGEIDRAIAVGGVPVSFGAQVLRAETAALFAISVVACATAT